jgi:acyl-coenzyme A synthetase/AMP-(fatty) acid ligase
MEPNDEVPKRHRTIIRQRRRRRGIERSRRSILPDCAAMNFAHDVVDAAAPDRRALVEITREGRRREWSFAEISERSSRLAAVFQARGVGPGDTVMTLIGNRPDWVTSLVACFRLGAVALPCNEQLRARDLSVRFKAADLKLVVADERNLCELAQARPACEVLTIPDERLYQSPARAAPVDLTPTDPALITFSSGTTGEAKGVVHAHRYLFGQRLQAKHWLDARPNDLVWCTAASGWSKSARNAFIAPWLRGATALLHDARFDAAER